MVGGRGNLLHFKQNHTDDWKPPNFCNLISGKINDDAADVEQFSASLIICVLILQPHSSYLIFLSIFCWLKILKGRNALHR